VRKIKLGAKYDDFIPTKRDDTLYVRNCDMERKRKLFFTSPSSGKVYNFMDMRKCPVNEGICRASPVAGAEVELGMIS
jgi:hypothetical protein